MRPAIIRLAKKLVLTSSTTHTELKQLWNGLNDYINDLNSRRSGPALNWRNCNQRYRDQLNEEATEYGEGIMRLLRSRLPAETNLTSLESSLVIERSRTEISDFTEECQSLVLHYFLVTEQMTLLDSMGDSLLLAKGNMTKAIQDGTVVQDPFTINLKEDYEIAEYTRIKPEL